MAAKIELLTVEEVATELRLSESTIRRLYKSGDLPRVNFGATGPRRYLISREQLDAYIRSHFTEAAS